VQIIAARKPKPTRPAPLSAEPQVPMVEAVP
jgi:hypothetical protein